MKPITPAVIAPCLIAAGLSLAACTPENGGSAAPAPGLANPASVYCVEKGGRLEPVTTAAGTSNTCILPNGERIDEWDLYRRDHPQ